MQNYVVIIENIFISFQKALQGKKSWIWHLKKSLKLFLWKIQLQIYRINHRGHSTNSLEIHYKYSLLNDRVNEEMSGLTELSLSHFREKILRVIWATKLFIENEWSIKMMDPFTHRDVYRVIFSPSSSSSCDHKN